MYLVVCYDIVENRRRARVARQMVDYLTRVQKSVSEGLLADDRLEPLRRMLLEEIDPVTDTVRIYRLCGRCIPATCHQPSGVEVFLTPGPAVADVMVAVESRDRRGIADPADHVLETVDPPENAHRLVGLRLGGVWRGGC